MVDPSCIRNQFDTLPTISCAFVRLVENHDRMMKLTLPLIVAVVIGLAVKFGWGQTPRYDLPPGLTCPGDQIVWVNTRSGIYHFQGQRYFGSTNRGKFICQRDADREGDRANRSGD